MICPDVLDHFVEVRPAGEQIEVLGAIGVVEIGAGDFAAHFGAESANSSAALTWICQIGSAAVDENIFRQPLQFHLGDRAGRLQARTRQGVGCKLGNDLEIGRVEVVDGVLYAVGELRVAGGPVGGLQRGARPRRSFGETSQVSAWPGLSSLAIVTVLHPA